MTCRQESPPPGMCQPISDSSVPTPVTPKKMIAVLRRFSRVQVPPTILDKVKAAVLEELAQPNPPDEKPSST